MSNLNRRLKKVEKALNLDKEQHVAEIVIFNDGPVPPNEIQGNRIIRHVRYSDVIKRNSNIVPQGGLRGLRIF